MISNRSGNSPGIHRRWIIGYASLAGKWVSRYNRWALSLMWVCNLGSAILRWLKSSVTTYAAEWFTYILVFVLLLVPVGLFERKFERCVRETLDMIPHRCSGKRYRPMITKTSWLCKPFLTSYSSEAAVKPWMFQSQCSAAVKFADYTLSLLIL